MWNVSLDGASFLQSAELELQLELKLEFIYHTSQSRCANKMDEKVHHTTLIYTCTSVDNEAGRLSERMLTCLHHFYTGREL